MSTRTRREPNGDRPGFIALNPWSGIAGDGRLKKAGNRHDLAQASSQTVPWAQHRTPRGGMRMTGRGDTWAIVSWMALVGLWVRVGTGSLGADGPARPGHLGDPFYDRPDIL